MIFKIVKQWSYKYLKRGYEGADAGIHEKYSGVADGSAVTGAPHVVLDITDKDVVEKVITEVNCCLLLQRNMV